MSPTPYQGTRSQYYILLQALPPDIRQKIFLPNVIEWNGKTPAPTKKMY